MKIGVHLNTNVNQSLFFQPLSCFTKHHGRVPLLDDLLTSSSSVIREDLGILEAVSSLSFESCPQPSHKHSNQPRYNAMLVEMMQ